MLNHIDVAPNNPMRTADWRWRRAAEILAGEGRPASKTVDGVQGFPWIRKAVRYMKKSEKATTELKQLRLADKYPDIFWAHFLWRQQTAPQRYSIEARLLAKCTSTEISLRTGFTHGAIDAYENLFFNVRTRLRQTGYILHQVMGPAIQRGLSDREYDLLWKLYGYFLGPHVLDALESRFVSPNWCHTSDSVNDTLLDDAVSTLKLRAAIAAKTVPVNTSTQLALLEQFTRFVEVERSTDSAGKSQSALLGHIAAMMNSLPFDIGGEQPGTEFDYSPVELTYEETVRASTGHETRFAPILRKLTYPTEEVFEKKPDQSQGDE